MDTELLFPVAARVAAALAGGMTLVLAAERKHLRTLGTRVLWLRWKTWAVTAPIFGIAATGPRALSILFTAAVGIQACREFSSMAALRAVHRRALTAAALLTPITVAIDPGLLPSLGFLILLVLVVGALREDDQPGAVSSLGISILGVAYIPLLLSPLVLLAGPAGHPGLLLALGLAIALSDVVAFCSGKLFGERPLAPSISPNKTIAGALGNIAGAYAGVGILWFALPGTIPAPVAWLLPGIVGVAAIVGDLTESLLKRAAGVKDAGSWMPGFGGMLDRIDSLLFALPSAYLLTRPWL